MEALSTKGQHKKLETANRMHKPRVILRTAENPAPVYYASLIHTRIITWYPGMVHAYSYLER